jgi:CheY-like chemotaxis protein
VHTTFGTGAGAPTLITFFHNASANYDLILQDHHLPDMTGIQMLAAAETAPGTAIILYSDDEELSAVLAFATGRSSAWKSHSSSSKSKRQSVRPVPATKHPQTHLSSLMRNRNL